MWRRQHCIAIMWWRTTVRCSSYYRKYYIDGVCKSKAINVEIRRSPGKTFLLASLIRKLGEKVSSFMLKWNWVEIKLNNFYCLFSQPKYFLLLSKIFIYKLKNENRFYKAFSEIDLSMINFKWERLQNTNIILPRKMRVKFSVIAIATSLHIAGPNKNQEENKSFLKMEWFSMR